MSLESLLEEALKRRASHFETWHSEGSNCYRLFHGSVEGFPSLSIDRTGKVLLLQTWKVPLEDGELKHLTEACSDYLRTPLVPCWNHLGPPLDLTRWHQPKLPVSCIGSELGLSFEVNPRHGGPDPLLFLDARPARRWMAQTAPGSSVLNLFANSCAIGIVAAARGAAEVWNVDRESAALDRGKRHATLNRMGRARIRWLESDCTPALRQLAGLSVRLQGERKIDFPSLEKRQFDRVILNPPRESRGPFGTVNLLKDYESWFRPALLCVRPGGQLLATHKSESVNREDWIHSIIRTAQSLDRDLDFEVLHPEADFPSSDEKPPLKMLVVEVR